MTLPFMISEKDKDLLGVAHRSDAMGVLAVWSVRARDIVPHLTEQTTDVRGFQILVEAFRLWELYEPAHPEHAGRLSDFFLLVEQAFARIIGWHGPWPLPGSRRVNARKQEAPHMSLDDLDWHLLGGQKANGLWGLYRGASRRAGLLLPDMTRLSAETLTAATTHPCLGPTAQDRFFKLAYRAMEGETVQLPGRTNNKLAGDICNSFRDVPLRNHLHTMLIEGHPLNHKLADRLVNDPTSDWRSFMLNAAAALPEHRAVLEDSIRCENLLSVVESVFFWICSSKGQTLEAAVAEMPIDLGLLAQIRTEFGNSGTYRGATAAARQSRFHEQLDTSSKVALARSVLELHKKVSDERKRATWVWEDNGVLHADVEPNRPSERDLQVKVAWRNDYYLLPLGSIAHQLAELRA